MRVALQYRPGTVLEDRRAENVTLLWDWLERLQRRPEHITTIALGDHVRIGGNPPYALPPVDFGFSIVAVDRLEDAVALTEDWPEFVWGGAIDIRPGVAR